MEHKRSVYEIRKTKCAVVVNEVLCDWVELVEDCWKRFVTLLSVTEAL